MRLYLMQHGPATSKEENPDRPLTEEGAEVVRRVAQFLGKAGGVTAGEIRHSGKLRARQTAETMVARLGAEVSVHESANLGPTDDVTIVADELGEESGDLMLVGHLPYMDRLASLLVCGDADREGFRFEQGGALCLESGEDGWQVAWMIVPELLEP